MEYVTDTHSVLWRLTNDPRLSPAAETIFSKAEAGETTIYVPTIVLAELLHLAEKHRQPSYFQLLLERVDTGSGLVTCPLSVEVVREMAVLGGPGELHDRIIVATARVLGAALITRDRGIRESRDVRVVW